MLDDKTALAAKLRAAIQKRRDEEEEERVEEVEVGGEGEEGESEFGTKMSVEDEGKGERDGEDGEVAVQELMQTLHEQKALSPRALQAKDHSTVEDALQGAKISQISQISQIPQIEMVEEETGEPSLIGGGGLYPKPGRSRNRNGRKSVTPKGKKSPIQNKEKSKKRHDKKDKRDKKGRKSRKERRRRGGRRGGGADMVVQALSILFDNQLELAAGQHRVITVPRRPVPKPRWNVVCKTMNPPQYPKIGAYVFFDGWDLYRTKEGAMDTTFVQPLIRMPNAVYDESGDGNETFVHRLVDGVVDEADENSGLVSS